MDQTFPNKIGRLEKLIVGDDYMIYYFPLNMISKLNYDVSVQIVLKKESHLLKIDKFQDGIQIGSFIKKEISDRKEVLNFIEEWEYEFEQKIKLKVLLNEVL